MNQPGGSTLEPRIAGADTSEWIDGIARVLTGGHSPSWDGPQIPDGLALCVGCWRLIAVWQLGGERCPGLARSDGLMTAAIRALPEPGRE
jgi:hypothetical protein